MIRHAVMLCVAPATLLFVDTRLEMDEVASGSEETRRQRATKVDLLTTSDSERIQFGGGMFGTVVDEAAVSGDSEAAAADDVKERADLLFVGSSAIS